MIWVAIEAFIPFFKKYWHIFAIIAIVVFLASYRSCLVGQIENAKDAQKKAEDKLATSKLQESIALADKAECHKQLDEQNASIDSFATAAENATLEAERRVAEIVARQLQERKLYEASLLELERRLAGVAQSDRCEVTAKWAAEEYRKELERYYNDARFRP